jgi:hypothetical protein
MIHTLAICIFIAGPILSMLVLPQVRAHVAKLFAHKAKDAPVAAGEQPGQTHVPNGSGTEMPDYSIYDEEPADKQTPVSGSP